MYHDVIVHDSLLLAISNKIVKQTGLWKCQFITIQSILKGPTVNWSEKYIIWQKNKRTVNRFTVTS